MSIMYLERLFYLPLRTPEMNPIEQIWKEIRKLGFKNRPFQTLDMVIQRLCDTCNSLASEYVKVLQGAIGSCHNLYANHFYMPSNKCCSSYR